MLGRIQSLQSFSTFDGPGTRCVVFLQGCPVGCVFCHNPDSWDPRGGEEIGVDALLRRLDRYRPFLQRPGLTLSGGEPLYQPDFALSLVNAAKAEGWHVALDTSGWGPGDRFTAVAGAADLVMFSFKHPLRPDRIARGTERVLPNWRLLAALGVPVWLRYVLIAGWTDEPEALRALGKLAREMPSLERIEILPYNSLAEDNWAKLGWDSPMFHGERPTVSEEQIRRAEELVAGSVCAGT